jgi:putative aldouronate transport system substrate-binding protein
MKRKSIISAILILFVFAVFMAGCNNTANTGTKTTTTPTPVATATDQDSEPITSGSDTTVKLPIVNEPFKVTIWAPNGEGIQKTMKTLSDSEYYKELERRTGVTVEFIHPPIGQQNDSFNLMVSSGNYPDIIEIIHPYGYMFPGGYDKAIEEGIILRLNELVDQYAPNYKKLLYINDQIRKESFTDSGNLPGFWSLSTNGAQPPWMGMVVRKDWLDDLGMSEPVTYDDWYNILKAFRDVKKAEAPMMLHFSGFNPMNIFEGGYGITETFFQVDGKVKYGPLEPGYKEYITMLSKWYAEDLIDKDFATKQDFIPSSDYTASNRTGAFYCQYIDFTGLKAKAADPNYNLVAVPTPARNAGDSVHVRQLNTMSGSVNWVVTSACKDPVTVTKWLDYNYTEEGDILAAYGFEGKTFEYGPDGKPVFTPFVYNNPDGYSLQEMYLKYAKLGGACIYHWEREFAGLPQNSLDAVQIWQKNNDGAYILPPITMTSDEGAEFARIMSDIDTYRKEMVLNFILGTEPLSNYDNFVNQIKSMNIDRAIELQQAALDRFNQR